MLRGFASVEENILTQEKVRWEDLNSFCILLDEIQGIEWRSGRSLVHIARRGHVRSADEVLVVNAKGNKNPGKPDVDVATIKMGLTE